MAVAVFFEKKSPMDAILNGKSIKADFEAQVTAALMIQSNTLIPLKLAARLCGIPVLASIRASFYGLRLSVAATCNAAGFVALGSGTIRTGSGIAPPSTCFGKLSTRAQGAALFFGLLTALPLALRASLRLFCASLAPPTRG